MKIKKQEEEEKKNQDKMKKKKTHVSLKLNAIKVATSL